MAKQAVRETATSLTIFYRWTEQEVEKTVRSMLPHIEPRFPYFYGFSLPSQRMAMSKSTLKKTALKLSDIFTPIFKYISP